MTNVANFKQEIIEAAAELVHANIMTKSNHGNMSLRLPGSDSFLLTAGGSLATLQPENIALFALDGTLIEGTVLPVGAEIIQMHGIVYRTRPEFTGVLHTHSPFATGFAVANQAIPVAYEVLARNQMFDGVPVAAYGPRGSDESVRNIEGVLKGYESIRALLLANHGVLTFGDSINAAVQANMAIEEAAEIILHSYKLGGPKDIPTDKARASSAQEQSFAAAGSYSVEAPRG